MNGDERMHQDDDYLWDRRGPVDADVARLERLLGGYRHAGAPRRARVPLHRAARPRRRWRIALAAVAVLACCAVAMQLWYRQRLQWDEGRPWQVVAQGGDVRIDGRNVKTTRAQLAIDGVLETGSDAAARLQAADIGEIAVGEGSRLRLVETRTGRHRVQLEHGRLWARVWAPPGQFGVGLHGMDVLDLGCEFLVEADARGNGTLTVLSGWVQVDNLWREVLVPQETRVRLRGAHLAGTPYDVRASTGFIAALEAIDARDGQVSANGIEVRRLIADSRPRDAISLLSLLQAYPWLADGPMFERMAQLLPQVPASRAAWARDREAQLDAWRHALPYPRIKQWWTQWPDALPLRNRKMEAWLRDAARG
jgi:hypothetical protein